MSLWKRLYQIAITEMREALLEYLQPVFALIRWLRNRRK